MRTRNQDRNIGNGRRNTGDTDDFMEGRGSEPRTTGTRSVNTGTRSTGHRSTGTTTGGRTASTPRKKK